VQQLVTTGGQGFRARGAYDPNADITYPYNNWLNTGQAGMPTRPD
jgi:hypothetical protein